MNTCRRHLRSSSNRRGFTLVELMVSIFVIAILASFLLMAMSGVRERAKERRALTQVVRVQELLMRRLDDYRVRSVPLRVSAGANPRLIPLARLLVIRDLMRLEMPDRKSDVIDPPAILPGSFAPLQSRLTASAPALQGVYQRRAMRATGSATLAQLDANWSIQNQNSECLYLVLSALQEGEANG
ncbi:MAG: type II secretion system GspH family protein, partial [bacterium]|nr:type II secretion system GspH family protein [bacterium]